MPTVQDLATFMNAQFMKNKRSNGEEYYTLKEGSPEWMRDVCHEAHGEMLPDDHRYEFIREAVQAASLYEDADEARDSIEAPIYTHDLTAWLASRTDRYGYCDEAIENQGEPFPETISLLTAGYACEQMEVFDLVLSALEDMANEDEEDEEAETVETAE